MVRRLRTLTARAVHACRRRWAAGRRLPHEAGMATAEYAVVTLAAVGFAGLLLVILKGGSVRTLLLGIIERALSS